MEEKKTELELEKMAIENRMVNKFEDTASEVVVTQPTPVKKQKKQKKLNRTFKETENSLIEYDPEKNFIFRYGILFLKNFSKFTSLTVKDPYDKNVLLMKLNNTILKVQKGQVIILVDKDLDTIGTKDFNLSKQENIDFLNNKQHIIYNGNWWVAQPKYSKIETTEDLKQEIVKINLED